MSQRKFNGSMDGVPWTKGKMAKAVEHVRKDGSVTIAFGAEELTKVAMLNDEIFRHRPDLVLHVWSVADNGRLTDRQLDHLTAMTNVKKLFVNGFSNPTLSALREMKQFTSLKIGTTKKFTLDFLDSLKRLTEIALFGRVKGLETVGQCGRLRTVRLSATIKSFDFFRPLSRVTTVGIDDCIAPSDFGPLNKPPLRDLSISSIRMLEDVDSLADFTGLRILKLAAPRVKRLPDLTRLENLRTLELGYMKVWCNPSVLQTLPRLRKLELDKINTKLKAEDFFFLTEMPSLKKVDFRFMDHNKRRIQKLTQYFEQQGKTRLLADD